MSNKRRRPPTQSPKSKASSATGAQKKSASSQRFAERQAAKQQVAQEARRTRNRTYGIVAIALVVVLVAVLVIVKVAGGGSGPGTVDQSSPPAGTPIPAATTGQAPIGPGLDPDRRADERRREHAAGGQRLGAHRGRQARAALHRRRVLPALRRRALAALHRVSPSSARSARQPGRIHSANQDGDVPTLTFYGTTYSSPYFTFVPVEVYTNKPQGNGYTTLQQPTQAQATLWQKTNGGSFPFVDFGGKQALLSAQYLYTPLQNLPFSEVAAQVGNNSTQIGANIDASAAQLIKTICGSLSRNEPANVCSAVQGG